MYLSRLTLDPRHRDTRRWLSDCHQLHQVVMAGFPPAVGPAARAEFGVLFRVETDQPANLVRVYVQSAHEPQWALETGAIVSVEGPRDMASLEAAIVPGNLFRFRVRANPTRRVHARALEGPDSSRMDANGKWRPADEVPDAVWNGVTRRSFQENPNQKGKRVEIRGEEERVGWLQRQGERCGFRLTRVALGERPVPATRADPAGTLASRARDLTFGTALFEGELEVTDEARFRHAWAEGIGPAKAFGCGMLSLAPVPVT